MDILTGFLVMFNSHPILVARLAIFYKIFYFPFLGGFLLFISACLTIYALRIRKSATRFLFFIPQQLFLLIKIAAVVDLIILGHYADGVVRSPSFILVDQLPFITLTIGYFFAIINFEKRKPI